MNNSDTSNYPLCGVIYAWIPFGFFVLFSLAFSVIYVFYFWKRQERDRFSAIISILALFITLIAIFILPVDVFLVSYMKNPNGTFKEWANNQTKIAIEDNVSYAYYNFYSAIVILAFLILPMAYFAYEETGDDHDICYKVVSSLRYTSVFLLFAVILIIIGAYMPYEHYKIPHNTTENLTTWQEIEIIFEQIESNRGLDALIFVLNVLTVIGMLAVIIYTSLGLSSFTIGNIRGWRSLKEEKEIIEKRKTTLEYKINELRNRERSVYLNAVDSKKLQGFEEEFQYTVRVLRKIEAPGNQWFRMCNDICIARFFAIIVGVVGVLIGLLLWTSLFIANLEKALRSYGFKSGYFIENLKWFNPLSYIMVNILKAFPVDYIFYFILIIFLIFCTVSGIRYTGIWCFCIQMFKVRPRHTEPQGLIMLCGILIYVVLALNILMYEVMPQYTTFGNQHYQVFLPNSTEPEIMPCDFKAPKGECLMTRASSFIVSFTVRASFFAAVYYYCTWVFLFSVVVGFFVVVCTKKKSLVDETIDEDDFDESDDEKPLIK